MSAALHRRGQGQAPLERLFIEAQLLETVHQVVEPLPLLVDDLPIVGQSVEQCLSLWHEQAPGGSHGKE